MISIMKTIKREIEYLSKEGKMALIIFTMNIVKNKILSKKDNKKKLNITIL